MHGRVGFALGTLRQQSSVDQFIDEVVALVSRVNGISDQQSLGYFLSRLRDDIRALICSHEAVDLCQTMAIALEVELENQFLSPSSTRVKNFVDGVQRWKSGPEPALKYESQHP